MKKLILLMLPLAIASCAKVAVPTTPSAKPSSIVEVHFEGIGSEKPSATMTRPSDPNSIGKQSLSEVNGLDITLVNVEVLTDRVKGQRYVQADYEITNTTASTIERLFITPIDLDDDGDTSNNGSFTPTIDDTPFTRVRRFDGTSMPEKAVDLLVGPAMYYDRWTFDYEEDLDAAPFYGAFDPTTFPVATPSGMAAVNVQPYTYFLEYPLTQNLDPGDTAVVTLSVMFNADLTTPSNNPFSFSMLVAFGQNPEEFKRVGEPLNPSSAVSGSEPSITLNASNNPVVAYTSANGYFTEILVKQWNGMDWNVLGSPLNLAQGFNVASPSIAHQDADEFVVAWSENNDIHVKQYDPATSTWNPLGGPLDMDTFNSATQPSVGLNSSNRPIVAWSELGSSGDDEQVYVKEWDGTDWVSLGGSLNVSPTLFGQNPDIAIDPTGKPYVAWVEIGPMGLAPDIYVKHWNGTTWDTLGTSPIDGSAQGASPSIAVDSSGNLTMAYIEDEQVKVVRWDDAGSTWTALGSTLNSNPAYGPKISLKSDGNPVVVWQENGFTGELLAKSWDGSNWVRFGDALNSNLNLDAYRADTITDGVGKTFVSFTEDENCPCGSTMVQVKTFP